MEESEEKDPRTIFKAALDEWDEEVFHRMQFGDAPYTPLTWIDLREWMSQKETPPPLDK